MRSMMQASLFWRAAMSSLSMFILRLTSRFDAMAMFIRSHLKVNGESLAKNLIERLAFTR